MCLRLGKVGMAAHKSMEQEIWVAVANLNGRSRSSTDPNRCTHPSQEVLVVANETYPSFLFLKFVSTILSNGYLIAVT